MVKRTIVDKRTVTLNNRTVDVRIAEHAKVTVVHIPPSSGGVSVCVECAAGSAVTWITFAQAKKDLRISQEGIVRTGAEIVWRIVTGGSGDLTFDLASRVTGADGKAQVEWAARARGRSKQTLSACNRFEAKNGSGDMILRIVAEGLAHVSCRGSIAIGSKGAGTKTHLAQEALMLDATTKVDAVPALEIKASDVKASHAASVTQITPETLFYLQSRGIPDKQARSMFVEGFLGEIVRRLPSALRQRTIRLL